MCERVLFVCFIFCYSVLFLAISSSCIVTRGVVLLEVIMLCCCVRYITLEGTGWISPKGRNVLGAEMPMSIRVVIFSAEVTHRH